MLGLFRSLRPRTSERDIVGPETRIHNSATIGASGLAGTPSSRELEAQVYTRGRRGYFNERGLRNVQGGITYDPFENTQPLTGFNRGVRTL